MTITPEQLKSLQLAHDAARDVIDELCQHISDYCPDCERLEEEADTALDTLTAAIEALKEGK